MRTEDTRRGIRVDLWGKRQRECSPVWPGHGDGDRAATVVRLVTSDFTFADGAVDVEAPRGMHALALGREARGDSAERRWAAVAVWAAEVMAM